MADRKTKRVVLRYEYLDGIEGLHVKEPDEYERDVWDIPAALIDEYDRAYEALLAAEDAIREAWKNAPTIPNPLYVGDDDEEGDDV